MTVKMLRLIIIQLDISFLTHSVCIYLVPVMFARYRAKVHAE